MEPMNAPSDWLRSPTNLTGNVSLRLAAGVRMATRAGSLISSEPQHEPLAYLVESGVVAVYAVCGRTPPTCVALAGPGILLEPDADGDFCYRAVGPVTVFRIPATTLEQEYRRDPALHARYLAQLRERLVQAELLANCNARHSVVERCSRWLLRLHGHFGDDIPVTHAFLASLLGVRRAGISETLERLQKQTILGQRHGRIGVIDPARLLDCACACRGAYLRSEHPLSVEAYDVAADVYHNQLQTHLHTVATLLARSKSAVAASRRILAESWKLRAATFHANPVMFRQHRRSSADVLEHMSLAHDP